MNRLEWNKRRRYSKSEVRTIQRVVGADPDGVWGPATVAAIVAFQQESGLVADGLVGPQTWEWVQTKADIVELPDRRTPSRLKWERVPADDWGNGYDRHTLREDVAERYMCVYREAHEAGAIITSSGSRRKLTARVGSNRSATSFHYVGRALDLFVYSGLVDPTVDPYVVTYGSDWRVWAAAENGKPRVLNAVVYRTPAERVTVCRCVIDLTDLFGRFGFRPIGPRRSFWKGGNNGGAEWWHFQDETGLVSGESTFGDELERLYSRKVLEDTAPWRHRRRVFGENWG